MVQITNIFTGIFSMFIGGLLIYAFNPIMQFFITNINDILIKLVMMLSYVLMTFVMLIYIPLKLFLSKEERDNP